MKAFNSGCTDCGRLSQFLKDVKKEHPGYYCKPVPPFGDAGARLLIVGLAPGKHGANASGRPFTGDFAGILLYQTLHKFGFATRPESVSADDGLELRHCRITNAVKCLPPENKPLGAEINQCNAYLAKELEAIGSDAIIIALGTVAHQSVLKAKKLKLSAYKFGHCAEHRLPDGSLLIDSYHCSRYNTQTRRLTPGMFENVFELAQKRLKE